MDSLFPTIPLGTLAANVLGGFLIGVIMAIIMRHHGYIPEVVRLAIITGFLGGLTTFSTFSAETVNLIFHREYFWTFVIITSHVGGSIAATICGVIATRLFIS